VAYPLRIGRSGLFIAACVGLWLGAKAAGGGSPREVLTPRVGRELPRAAPYRVVTPGPGERALALPTTGEPTLVVLSHICPASYHEPQERLFREVDAVMSRLPVEKVRGVVLGEGNVPWGGGVETLNSLYQHIKTKWGVPVFQCYASPLTPHPAQLADGWVVWPVGLEGEDLRRHLVKFLVTGKPVLRLEGAPSRSAEAAPLMSLCQRLAVPASFLPVAGCLPLGAPPPVRRQSASVAYDLSQVWKHMPEEADTLEAGPVEVGGDRVKRFDYADEFRHQWFLDDATIAGVSRVRWLGEAGVKILGGSPRREVTLTYDFLGPWETRELVVELAGMVKGKAGDFVELAISRDGKRFVHPARAYGRPEGNPFRLTSVSSYRFDRERFWVRVSADLSPGSEAALEFFRVNCRVKPPGMRLVRLSPSRDGLLRYSERFVSRRMLHTAQIDNTRALEWTRGGFYLRRRDDRPVEVHIRQRFQADRPLAQIVVRIHNAVLGPEGHAQNAFALSTDGASPIATASARPTRGGWFGVTELKADATTLPTSSMNSFYLHITLTASGECSAEPSNILGGIEVEAVPASPGARLAAAN